MLESTDRLPDVVKASQPQIPWTQVKAFRNLVVHDYLSVDLDRVWNVISESLPALDQAIEAILLSLDDGPPPASRDEGAEL